VALLCTLEDLAARKKMT